ncbi:MAG TPA: divalent-cation tolerance protein CutA [Methanoregula sp.]|nr:divalent-cation tolerance protein CutA [Methanoregula sp.]
MRTMSPAAEIVVVYSTVPTGESARISRELLDRRLVACVSIVPVRSMYRWRGAVCNDGEDLLIMKTRKSRVPELIPAIREIHPYEVPEIVVLPVTAGSPPYLDWVRTETRDGA